MGLRTNRVSIALVLLQAPHFPFGLHESTHEVAYAVSSSCRAYLFSLHTNFTFGLAWARLRRGCEAVAESFTH